MGKFNGVVDNQLNVCRGELGNVKFRWDFANTVERVFCRFPELDEFGQVEGVDFTIGEHFFSSFTGDFTENEDFVEILKQGKDL